MPLPELEVPEPRPDCWVYRWDQKTGGQFIPESESTISVRAHGLHYGAIFEGVAVHPMGQGCQHWFSDLPECGEGRVIYHLDMHLDRFQRGIAAVLHKPADKQPDCDTLARAIIELLRKNPADDNYVRPVAFYGPPADRSCGLDPQKYPLMIYILTGPFRLAHPRGNPDEGWRMMISSWRRPAPDQGFPATKASANYPLSIAALLEARDQGYDGAFLLSPDGRSISEAEVANVFLILDKEIATPDRESGCLLGITRFSTKRSMQRLLGHRIAVGDEQILIPESFVERKIAPHELLLAKGVFTTGSATFIRHVTQINGQPVGDGRPHPVSRAIERALWEDVTGRSGDLQHLTYIPPRPIPTPNPAELEELIPAPVG